MLKRPFLAIAAAPLAAALPASIAQADDTPIGPNDTMIAAIARNQGVSLVTNNTAEFSRVQGLSIENWQSL